jgi:hypothetical protein
MLAKLIDSLFGNDLSEAYRELRRNVLDEYSDKSYSQEGEDMILKRIFDGVRSGFYIDVGSHHPKRFSNTYYFYKRGWCGINIDAMPGSMELFDRCRPRDINLELAISDSEQELKYHIFNEPALNGFDTELAKCRDGKDGYQLIDRRKIKTVTLESVLDAHIQSFTHIEFLSVDVEGYDMQVLQSMNLDKYRPKIVLVEMLNSSLEMVSEGGIARLMRSYGYDAISKCFNTVFFAEREMFKDRTSGWSVKNQ